MKIIATLGLLLFGLASSTSLTSKLRQADSFPIESPLQYPGVCNNFYGHLDRSQIIKRPWGGQWVFGQDVMTYQSGSQIRASLQSLNRRNDCLRKKQCSLDYSIETHSGYLRIAGTNDKGESFDHSYCSLDKLSISIAGGFSPVWAKEKDLVDGPHFDRYVPEASVKISLAGSEECNKAELWILFEYPLNYWQRRYPGTRYPRSRFFDLIFDNLGKSKFSLDVDELIFWNIYEPFPQKLFHVDVDGKDVFVVSVTQYMSEAQRDKLRQILIDDSENIKKTWPYREFGSTNMRFTLGDDKGTCKNPLPQKVDTTPLS